MRWVALSGRAAAIGFWWLQACSSPTSSTSSPIEDLAGGPGANCDQASRLIALAEVINNPTHACHGWVDRTYGRALATSFGGSTSIVSTRTPRGTAIITSSFHEFGAGTFGPPGQDVPSLLRDPTQISPLPIARRIDERGFPVTDSFGGIPIFHPAVPATQASNIQTILPRSDYVVSIVDGDTAALTSRTGVSDVRPVFHDPGGSAELTPSYADVHAGEVVIAFGLPNLTTGTGVALAVDRVLSDDDARDAIKNLAQLGDSEGTIPYDPEVEFIARGDATKGMSGGGAFTQDGRHAGILVRASDVLVSNRRYVRFVRTSYVMKQLTSALASADAATKSALAPYLEQ